MSERTKAEESANHIQNILDAFHRSNSENARLRSEVASLRLQLRKTGKPTDDVFAMSATNRKARRGNSLFPSICGISPTGRQKLL